MEMRHLRSFLAVVEERNVTRAAARLFIAQPALSRQLRHLERAVGARLFERHSRGVQLTPAGTALVPRARQAVSAFDAITPSTPPSTPERVHGTVLTVGYVAEYYGGLISGLVHGFRERHPEISLRLRHYDFDNPSAGAGDGSAHIGIHTEAVSADGCRFHPIPWMPPVPTTLMISAQHPLAALGTVTLQDVERSGVIQCTPPNVDPLFQLTWSGYTLGLRSPKTFVPRNFDEYVTNVSAGDMAGFTMDGTVGSTDRVRTVAVADFPPTRLGLWINHRYEESDTVRLFRDHVESADFSPGNSFSSPIHG